MKIVLVSSVVLFVAACCIPALQFNKSQGGDDMMLGANVLGVGWSGIFAGVYAWYANPVWLLGLIMGLVGKPRVAAICGLAALAIGFTTFAVIGKMLPADEGGSNQMTLVKTLAGCYVWLASLAALPLVVFFPRVK
jgi:hypothetical protein